MRFWVLFFFYTAFSRLLAVVELCRHGARTPLSKQPWDGERWADGPGQLISEGMRQHYLIGSELRNRYIIGHKLLQANYYQPEIYIVSSDFNRTLMSAQSQLQGLYPMGTGENLRSKEMFYKSKPPIGIQNFDSVAGNLGMAGLPGNIQVVPIHTNERKHQITLVPKNACSYYEYLTNERENMKDEINNIFNEYLPSVQILMTYLNCSQDYIIDNLEDLADSLTSNVYMENSLPKEFTQKMISDMESLAYKVKSFINFEPDFNARLASTALMNSIFINLKQVIYKEITQKFFLYSAHDSTVSFALAYLQLDFSQPPPFASTIIWELYEDEQKYYVNIKYNDMIQKLKGCLDYNCTFQEYELFVLERSIENLEEVCEDWENLEDESKEFLKDINLEDTYLSYVGSKGYSFSVWYLLIAICLFVIVLKLLKKRFTLSSNDDFNQRNYYRIKNIVS
ncbi:hypothetical protein SteCoe_13930 [Stentor coeruleus]|uniref:Acid phosphatase n=1 Tax=Stentor coeruleus TaxID=5963 RepID=A0A1R2C776_9CILI|nr:hypothetical protein SteCoe_13930 [Stentor coeruleus]